MTNFVNAVGVRVPVANTGRTREKIGADGDQLLGLHRAQHLGHRQAWVFDTVPMAGVDADSLEAILDGRAHVMSFDADTWSARGLPPLVVVGVVTAGGKWGNYLNTSAAGSNLTYPVDFIRTNTLHTAIYWRFNGATWDHYIARDDGAKWVNGVRNDAAAVFHTVTPSAGTLFLAKDKHDDLVILPGRISVAHAPLVYAFHNANPWPLQRLVTFDGLFVEGGAKLSGRAFDIVRKAAPSFFTGGWDDAGANLNFKLIERKT